MSNLLISEASAVPRTPVTECITSTVTVMRQCSILVKHFNFIFLQLKKCEAVQHIRIIFLVIIVSTKKKVQLCYEVPYINFRHRSTKLCNWHELCELPFISAVLLSTLIMVKKIKHPETLEWLSAHSALHIHIQECPLNEKSKCILLLITEQRKHVSPETACRLVDHILEQRVHFPFLFH